MKKALITGSSGLVGSAAARLFASRGFTVIGIDNDMRRSFFGDDASTSATRTQLIDALREQFIPITADIRDTENIAAIFSRYAPFDVIIHAAGQPSHDWSAQNPLLDFDVNARGTLVMLEAFRTRSPKAVFMGMSTNKVYGDAVNSLPFLEHETRYDLPENHEYYNGIPETFTLDASTHTIMGVSKVSADLLTQEYGRYFGLATATFRACCITGSAHKGVQLHGFLSYLAKAIATGKPYQVFGFKGKQVRDQIHADDLAHMFWHVAMSPRSGEAYNVGGSRAANLSVLEAVTVLEQALSKRAQIEYVLEARTGDHQWYISDMTKFRTHYPEWGYAYDLDAIVNDVCISYR